MSDINWKTELRKIEREFDGLPPDPSVNDLRASRGAERRAKQRKNDRTNAIGAGARLVLVVTLGIAIFAWPYRRDCGADLLGYVGAESMIIVGALWAAAWTWRSRMPRTHIISVALMIWGMALIAADVVPRIGYGKVHPDEPPRWRCVTPVY